MSDQARRQTPSVGRIVLFTPATGYIPVGSRSGVPGNNATEYLAIVGQIVGDSCNLYVLPPFADGFWEGSVKEGEGPRTWRWPPRT